MTEPVRAAGAVVWRHGDLEPDVLLIRRPRYDDWSLPKGKLDPGEAAPVAAVREVAEETGVRIRLGPPLPDQHYTVGGGEEPQPKVVSYWAARAPADADVSSFVANREVDEVRWEKLSRARSRLTYPRDARLLDSFDPARIDTTPLLVVRHAQARSRKNWSKDEGERPLRAQGQRQAAALVPLLTAYGVRQVVSSDEARCVETMLPFVNADGATMGLEPGLSQRATDEKVVARRTRRALDSQARVAFCSHRPVLPLLFEGLGLDPIAMQPASLVVVHRRDGRVVAVEHHPPAQALGQAGR